MKPFLLLFLLVCVPAVLCAKSDNLRTRTAGGGTNDAKGNSGYSHWPATSIITAPATRFSFSLPDSNRMQIEIIDILSRKFAALRNGFMLAGDHAVTFDGITLSAGIYFARLTTPHRQATLRLVLIK